MRINAFETPLRLAFLSLLAVAILLIFGVGTVQAQADGNQSTETDSTQVETTATDQSTEFVPEKYEYTIEECNNATLLVRRSLQLYDQADVLNELSNAQIVYAETNIVQDIDASDLIYPNDIFEVPGDLVAKYARSAQDLSQSQKAAWQVYADQASFELDEIGANNVAVTDDGTVVEAVDGDVVDEVADTSDQTSDDVTTDDDSNSAVWWVAGGISVFTLWYLLWQRGGQEE